MIWRFAIPILVSLVIACLRTTSGEGEGEEIPDGGRRDFGPVPPDRDRFIPEGCVEVLRVIDGDTFDYINEIGEEIRVRLLGINTPEQEEDCYGRARSALASMIAGQIIRVDRDDDADNIDMFKRELRYVSLCGSEILGEVNLQLVRGGWACVFERYVGGLELEDALREAQRNAASSRSGCWESDPGFCG